MHDEPAPGILGRLDRRLAASTRTRVEPARGVEADGVADAPVGARAEAQQRRVELLELRGHPLRRRERRAAAIARAACESGASCRRDRPIRRGIAERRRAALRRVGSAAVTASRRTMACSKVFSAATWRTLTWRSPLRRAFAEGSRRPHFGDDDAARRAAPARRRCWPRSRTRAASPGACQPCAARPGTLMCRQSASSAMLTSSDVMPKLTNGNVTPVSGSTARLPATVTASWHSASTTQATREPAQERLVVVDDAALRDDEARLAARDAAVVADQPVQPDRAAERQRPGERPAERADERGERVVALDLRRHAGAAAGARVAAPRHGAEAEARRRRGALEPGDQRELIVGRRERRGEVLEPGGGDVVDRAELEQRQRRRQDPQRRTARPRWQTPRASRRCAGATTSRSTRRRTRPRRSRRSAAAPCRA